MSWLKAFHNFTHSLTLRGEQCWLSRDYKLAIDCARARLARVAEKLQLNNSSRTFLDLKVSFATLSLLYYTFTLVITLVIQSWYENISDEE